ncbi:MAG: Cystathionine beta-lyase PatB [Acidimicrobiales bacterium AG-410-I20]|nr:MAG: Cystathionine beta-lyase PatB [Acidimicrobiales bacterium AG-410-I20]
MDDKTLPSALDLSPEGRRQMGLAKWNRYDDALAAWVAEHDFGAPPAVYTRLQELVEGGAFGYHHDFERVLDSFTRWSTVRHNWTPNPELGLLTVNVIQGIWSCVEAFTRPGDGVLFSTPIYPPFFNIGPTTKRRPVHWSMTHDQDGWHYDFEKLENLLISDSEIRLIVLCHPHNPTGRVLSSSELELLVDIAHRYGLIIVSDEIHGDLVHPEATHIPMLTIPGAEDCTVTVTSGIKTFAFGGIRCAVAQTGSKKIFEQLNAVPAYLLGGANRMGAEASITAWDTGETWVDEMKKVLDSNRHLLLNRLNEDLPAINMHLPQSTFVAWLDLSNYDPGERPATWMRGLTNVAGQNGLNFGSEGAGHLRLTFGTSPEVLNQMIDQMVEGLPVL